MANTPTTYLKLPELAARTGLPKTWLKDEAAAGRLPFIQAGSRKLFNLREVETALLERSGHSRAALTDELAAVVAGRYGVEQTGLRPSIENEVERLVQEAADKIGCEPGAVPPADVARLISQTIENFKTGNVPTVPGRPKP